MFAVRGLFDLHDSLKARLCCHELEDVVDSESTTKLTLESRSLETLPDFDSSMLNIDAIINIKETWRATNLFKISLSESLFDNDINQILAH